MTSKQATLDSFSHPKKFPSKEHEEEGSEINKADPKDENQSSQRIEAYGEKYEADISKEELKEDILEFIEQNNPIFFEEIFEKFSNNKDPILLDSLGLLYEEGKLYGYRKNKESLIALKEVRKDGLGNPVKVKAHDHDLQNEHYFKEPDPDREKSKTTRDKSPRELSLSRDEEKLVSILRGLHQKLASKERNWIYYSDIKENRPKNWLIYRLDRTLIELIRLGILKAKGISSKCYRINLERLNEIQKMDNSYGR